VPLRRKLGELQLPRPVDDHSPLQGGARRLRESPPLRAAICVLLRHLRPGSYRLHSDDDNAVGAFCGAACRDGTAAASDPRNDTRRSRRQYDHSSSTKASGGSAAHRETCGGGGKGGGSQSSCCRWLRVHLQPQWRARGAVQNAGRLGRQAYIHQSSGSMHVSAPGGAHGMQRVQLLHTKCHRLRPEAPAPPQRRYRAGAGACGFFRRGRGRASGSRGAESAIPERWPPAKREWCCAFQNLTCSPATAESATRLVFAMLPVAALVQTGPWTALPRRVILVAMISVAACIVFTRTFALYQRGHSASYARLARLA